MARKSSKPKARQERSIAAPEKGAASTPTALTKRSANAAAPPAWLPIVGIGASAGGIDALTQILRRLPDRLGVPIVVVQHLSPHHRSLLGEILQEATRMAVTQVTEDAHLEANHVYVIPPDRFLQLDGPTLRLLPHPGVGSPHAIDSFFRSLAQAAGPNAVGIVLSGTGSDGAIGLREIHAVGGITMAQTPESAEHDGMPRAAIATNVVDLVLTPEEIADELVEISRHPPQYPAASPEAEASPSQAAQLARVFAILRKGTGVDFAQYKKATVQRRLQRRMLLHKMSDLSAYLQLLERDRDEVKELQQDLLIQVTSFFREASSYELLTQEVFPEIFRRRTDGPIRFWVPGCATGEEAYSLAMVLMEALGADAPNTPVQIFATDVSESALESARAGGYPENISADVAPERLRRFFTRADGMYRISQAVREICVFARQDVTRDPPFSRLDLILCRNLLIYLEPPLQKKLMGIFHYALRPAGFLLLGQAETVGASADLFSIVDKGHKLYAKKSVQTPINLDFGPSGAHASMPVDRRANVPSSPADNPLLREARQLILNRYGPPGVIIDAELAIVETLGQTAPFLELPSGAATLNILRMARQGLSHALRMAAHTARRENRPVRREKIRISSDGEVRLVNVSVTPLSDGRTTHYFLVLFEDVTVPTDKKARVASRDSVKNKDSRQEGRVEILEQELEATRLHMQAMIQDLEAANEELQSANEEILSSNEELQSTNEELNTAREELQSTNEEINTVNEELHGRNDELIRVNSDLTNLLASVQATIVIVGADLRIRRFTPLAERSLNLIHTDIGRPIHHIKPNLDLEGLEDRIRAVIDGVTPYSAEVRDGQGRWMKLNIRPYKDLENRIDGAVLTLNDIDQQKRTEDALQEEQEIAQAVRESVGDWVVTLDGDFRIVRANAAFCEAFRAAPDAIVERELADVDGGWGDPRIETLLTRARARTSREENLEAEIAFDACGRRRAFLRARRVERASASQKILLVTTLDGSVPE